jgi:SOS-response transcriptional repressor LexA
VPDTPARRHDGRPRGSATGRTRARVLVAIQRGFESAGVWPGRRQLAGQMGISEGTITVHRRQLIDEGLLPAEAANPDRAVRVRTERPMLPLIASGRAGRPAPTSVGLEPVDIIDLITGGDPDCYGVVVADDLMADVSIHAGDIAVIRPQSVADEGTIVLAQVTDSRTGRTSTVVRALGRDAKGKAVFRSARARARSVAGTDGGVVGVVISVMRRIAV